MKPLSPKERWRVAVHEAAHAVFEHHLGLGTSDSATIIPAGEYLGKEGSMKHRTRRFSGVSGSTRRRLEKIASGTLRPRRKKAGEA